MKAQTLFPDIFGDAPSAIPRGAVGLEQYWTPAWASESLMEHFFPNLTASDGVIDPACGLGSFLQAIPAHVPAIGVEIDPTLISAARENTGRNVICGDFTTIPLDFKPTVIVGNPPFAIATVRAFLARAYQLLPRDGRCGFLLPAHAFQHAHTVTDLHKDWSISQRAIPRDIFHGLSTPLVFAMFVKEEQRRLVGFALYEECNAVKRMPKPMRYLLIKGSPRKTSWRTLVEFVLTQLGGKAKLDSIYAHVAPLRHTENQWWREKVRQVLQMGPFVKDGDQWALAETAIAA
jgi:predicted RNA methylase